MAVIEVISVAVGLASLAYLVFVLLHPDTL